MGTELIARGLDPRADIAERWVLERSDTVCDIHRGYAQAGAEALLTCSFGALRTRLAVHGLSERVPEICAAAVQAARRAAPRLPILGSLGPTGLLTSPERTADPAIRAQISAEVGEAAIALAAAGADLLCLETLYHPLEVVAAAEGARRSGLPLWISVTVAIGDQGLVTPHGVPFDRMLRALREAAPDAVGVNCSLDAERMRDAVARLVAERIAPVFARPQARMSAKCATGRSGETPARFAEHAVQLFDAGAVAVGGCCGSHPASIAALAEKLAAGRRPLIAVAK